MDLLLLALSPLTGPSATQVCDLTGNRTSDLSLSSQTYAQSTEPHQSGREFAFLLSLCLSLPPKKEVGVGRAATHPGVFSLLSFFLSLQCSGNLLPQET